jgi:hypothetical protein
MLAWSSSGVPRALCNGGAKEYIRPRFEPAGIMEEAVPLDMEAGPEAAV